LCRCFVISYMKKTIIGVMGPGLEPTTKDLENAYDLGKRIAQEGWVLLSGGVKLGVMDVVSKGAKEANGLTIGIIPTDDTAMASEYVDLAIITDMGSARNNINALTSDVVIACGIGAGTVSEIALALKAKKQVILLNDNKKSQDFFKDLGKEQVYVVNTPEEAIEMTKKVLT